MFFQTAEYALRAVACIARQSRGAMTTRQIADAVRVPAGYLSKILQALARAGVVTGQRGLNGGFVLARRPEELTLLDVVRVADGSRRITACPLGLPDHGPGLCPLHRRLDDAVAQAEQTLGGVTIADVLDEPLCSSQEPSTPACTGERAGACRPDSDRRSDTAARRTEKDRGCAPNRAGTARLSPLCDRNDCTPGAAALSAKCA
jgi:Rrf2 family transcriptional regulator, nitric oxide-sensitive transcriptional repressor